MLVSEGHVNDTHCTHLHTVKSWCSIGSQHHIMWTSSTYRAEILYHQQNHWAPKLGFVWKCGIKWYKYTLNHTSSILIPSNISNPSIPASNDHFDPFCIPRQTQRLIRWQWRGSFRSGSMRCLGRDLSMILIQFGSCTLFSYLVGGLEHFLFFHIVGIIIPTDFHIFQRGRSTTNQLFSYQIWDDWYRKIVI